MPVSSNPQFSLLTSDLQTSTSDIPLPNPHFLPPSWVLSANIAFFFSLFFWGGEAARESIKTKFSPHRDNTQKQKEIAQFEAQIYHLTEVLGVRIRILDYMIIYVYVKDHMSALQIKNTCESDPRSYEVT